MNINIRIPNDFDKFSENLMTNFDHSINSNTENAIKGKKYYSQYSGWNFSGQAWYENDIWYCEIWQFGNYMETISAETLQEIMDIVSNKYGSE